MASETFADHVEDLKPVISAGLSDSAALDAVAELMVRAGRDLPMVKTMLIPEAWGDEPSMPQAYRDLYSYCNAVMEPWDGRSEEHTSELQSLMRISYAVFCLKQKNNRNDQSAHTPST